MTDETPIDPEQFELRLPLWAVTDEEGFRKRGLPGALRTFVDDFQGPFLDLFTREDIAKDYLRMGRFTNWRAVELTTPAQVRSAALVCEQRGCLYVGLDCTGPQSRAGRFFSIRQFLAFVGPTG
jgi:hypothetical protein